VGIAVLNDRVISERLLWPIWLAAEMVCGRNVRTPSTQLNNSQNTSYKEEVVDSSEFDHHNQP